MSIMQEKFKAIADKIREKTGTIDLIVPNEFVNKIDDVYDAGKKAEYDKFWDAYQQNGQRRSYAQTFYNDWDDITFKPKYDIICVGNSYGVFGSSKMTAINKVIDVSQATNIGAFFTYCDKLITITKFVVSQATPFVNNTFNQCSELVNLTIEGTIGQNGFDIHWSTKLSAASLYSIILALQDTPIITSPTITLPSTAEANYNANPPEGAPATWLELVGDGTEEHPGIKPNWTIAYA